MDMHDILRQDPDIWNLFTCQEVYNTTLCDMFDRVPYYTSQYRDIFTPRSSQYLADHGYTIDFPNNATFAVCVTHDIDEVYSSMFSKCLEISRELKKSNIKESVQLLSQIRSKKIPLLNFSNIMDIEERYGAKSTFFLMAENQGEQDYSYDIEDLEPEIREIIDRGWEVGLHGGLTTYSDPKEMALKKARLETVTRKPVIGYRNHFLKFRIPDTWEHLSQAGFRYDTTFGYADCVGFRNGMCHPFRPMNLNTGQQINIVEIPLIIMDQTLVRYMCLDEKGRWDITKRLIDITESCHGVLTILWHNSHMNKEWYALYDKILRYCAEKGGWMSSGEEILKEIRI